MAPHRALLLLLLLLLALALLLLAPVVPCAGLAGEQALQGDPDAVGAAAQDHSECAASAAAADADADAGDVLEAPRALPGAGEGSLGKLELGESVKLDSLGPIIINPDGTTRRITNWDALSERERAWALKRIAKRNNERRETLGAEHEEQV